MYSLPAVLLNLGQNGDGALFQYVKELKLPNNVKPENIKYVVGGHCREITPWMGNND